VSKVERFGVGPPGFETDGRYSSLRDIHRGNVKDLRVAWTYRRSEICFRGAGRTFDRIDLARTKTAYQSRSRKDL
jgi:glucose dehydrogenase